MDSLGGKITDNQGREIVIGFDDINIVAEYEKKEIGRFCFDIQDNVGSPYLLTNCNVDSEFERNGIGLKMMELAEDSFGAFEIVNHLAEEGARFLEFCELNIFKEQHELIDDNRY